MRLSRSQKTPQRILYELLDELFDRFIAAPPDGQGIEHFDGLRAGVDDGAGIRRRARACVRDAAERKVMAERFQRELLRLCLHGTLKPEKYETLASESD